MLKTTYPSLHSVTTIFIDFCLCKDLVISVSMISYWNTNSFLTQNKVEKCLRYLWHKYIIIVVATGHVCIAYYELELSFFIKLSHFFSRNVYPNKFNFGCQHPCSHRIKSRYFYYTQLWNFFIQQILASCQFMLLSVTRLKIRFHCSLLNLWLELEHFISFWHLKASVGTMCKRVKILS